MKKTATLSECERYRYVLTRCWSDGASCAFIGLNPSTADADLDDPTIRRCINFAKSWGYGRLVMLNAYAFRSTDPNLMKAASDPIGPHNDDFIGDWVAKCEMLVACWGAKIERPREEHLRQMLNGRLHYLRLTKAGKPGHPLYLPKTLTPLPWVYEWSPDA